MMTVVRSRALALRFDLWKTCPVECLAGHETTPLGASGQRRGLHSISSNERERADAIIHPLRYFLRYFLRYLLYRHCLANPRFT